MSEQRLEGKFHSFTNLKIRQPNLKVRDFITFLIRDSGFGFG